MGPGTRVRPKGRGDWQVADNSHGYNDNARGLGLLDLAYAVAEGRKPRASGDVAYHVLDAMLSILQSNESGRFETLRSTCERPEPLPERFP